MRCCRRCAAIFSIRQTSCFVSPRLSLYHSVCLSDCVSLLPAHPHHTQTRADRHVVNTVSITLNHNHRVFSCAKQHDICPEASVQSHSHTQHTVSRMHLCALKLHGHNTLLPLSPSRAARITLHYSLGYPLPLVMDKGTA